MGLDFIGRVFEDNFLIADVIMDADFPVERWFWFDPPFNRGQSALLHKQPDNVWRIDLQLGWDIDRDAEKKPDIITQRIKEMLGNDIKFTLEWVSIYTFQCRRMEKFRHGRVIFAGDSAHQVSPFGARGANGGVQDADNLGWKLKAVINGNAPDKLIDSYDSERIYAADENIRNSTHSTDFITPKSPQSRIFRDAVLDLAETYSFARPLVNSGRLSLPCVYDSSPLNTSDGMVDGPSRTRPGAPCVDAPLSDGYLLQRLGGCFSLLLLNIDPSTALDDIDANLNLIILDTDKDSTDALHERYLGSASQAVYLIRPDQHIAARWSTFDARSIYQALQQALAGGSIK